MARYPWARRRHLWTGKQTQFQTRIQSCNHSIWAVKHLQPYRSWNDVARIGSKESTRGGEGGEHCGDRISNASGAWRIDALQMNAICLFLGQEYILNDVRDREFLLYFHKKAKKVGLDVAKYNELKDSVARIEADLKRLRDPLRIHSAVASSAGRQPGSSLPTTASLWDKAQFRMSTLLRSAKEPKQWIRRTPQRTLLSHCYLLSTVLFRFHEFDPSNRTWRIETD